MSAEDQTHSFFFYLFRDKVEKLEVILGRTFRKINSSSEQIFGVEKYWIHEKFNTETFDNDIGKRTLRYFKMLTTMSSSNLRSNHPSNIVVIPTAAILKLKTDIGICAINSPEVYPVCLPERGLVLPDWTECEISGYGKETECKLPSPKRAVSEQSPG